MKPKKAVKELERQLRKEPENLVLRLRLAAALRELGRTARAVELYRGVAAQYRGEGRLSQAIAVCKSVLEVEPGHAEMLELLGELEASARAADADLPVPPSARSSGGRSREVSPRTPPANTPAGGGASPGRSGLTPLGDALHVPSLAPVSERSPAVDGRSTTLLRMRLPRPKSEPPLPSSRPPGVPGPRHAETHLDTDLGEPTERSSRASHPTTRTSGLRITPTPLPAPLPSHELDDDSLLQPLPSPSRATPSRPAMPSPAPLAPYELDDDSLLQPLPSPSRATLPMPPPLPPARVPAPRLEPRGDPDVDEDAMTRVADDAGWRPDAAAPADPDPVRRAAPSDPFGGVTRMGDSLGLVDPSLLEVTGAPRVEAPATPPADTDKAARVTARLGGGGVADDDGPDDREPATGRALGRRAPGAPARGARVRATAPRPRPPPPPPLRAVSEGDTRDTEVRDRLDRADSAAGTQRVPRVTERDLRGGSVADEEVTQESRRSAPTADPPDDDEMLDLDRGFPRPYSETVESLAPDGSTIEAPLALFAALPDDAVAELVRRMSKRTVPAGNIVLHEGDPGDACFVIASGEVRVLKRDPRNAQSDLIEVARLGTGSIFGAFALLADRRRHATVQAVADTALYRIPRTLLRELAANYPAVGPALQRFYRERLLATLLSTAPFFGPIEQERRTELLARFAPIRMESGERVVTEGAPAGGLYLIVLGTVEITKRVAGQRSVRLSTLGEGAYFGELSLMRGGVARATVTAAGPTELAKLPARDFYDIVAAYPVLWERLRQEAHRRELMMSQLVAGDTGVV